MKLRRRLQHGEKHDRDDESHGEQSTHAHHQSHRHQAPLADHRAGDGSRADRSRCRPSRPVRPGEPGAAEWVAGGEDSDAEGNDLPDGVGAGLDLRKLGMFGFSLGGYASANTMLADERVTAGIDLDGTLQDDPVKGPLGEVARTGLDRPSCCAETPRSSARSGSPAETAYSR